MQKQQPAPVFAMIGVRCVYLAGMTASRCEYVCNVRRRLQPARMPAGVSACCNLGTLLDFSFVCPYRNFLGVGFNQLMSAANLMALPLFVGVRLGC
jgi:hypothetical protein